MSGMDGVRLRKKKSCLPAADARLLRQINRGFPNEWWEGYHKLLKKRDQGRLTPAEHWDLILKTDQVERREAKRLQALVKLAKLRKQSLSDLMAALGLPERADG